MNIIAYLFKKYVSLQKTFAMDYYRIYMQQESEGAEIIDTIDSFGLYCVDIPFKIADVVKDVVSRDWHDEDGIDEYIPKDGLKMSAYDMDVKFGFKGDKFAANESISAFIDYLKSGYIKLYCNYTKIGRQHVRLVKLNDSAELVRNDDGDILVFSVTFKVCDPLTNISLSK